MTPIRKPKQARSLATYERLLDAAQEVMATKSFDAASIQEISDTAGVTIGAFYARFSGKEALLLGISERLGYLIAELLERLESFAESSPPFEQLVRHLVQDSADFYSRHRGVLRPLRRTARADPELSDRTRAMNSEIKARLSAYLLSHGDSIRRPNPELAVEAALTMLFSTLRMSLVEDDLFPEDRTLTRAALLDELTAAVVAHLGTDAAIQGDSA